MKLRGRVVRCVHRAIFMYTVSLVQNVLCQILIDGWLSTHWRISVWSFKCSLRPMFADVFNLFFFFFFFYLLTDRIRVVDFFAWELCACVCVCVCVRLWPPTSIPGNRKQYYKRGKKGGLILTDCHRKIPVKTTFVFCFSLFPLSFQEVTLPPMRGYATAPVPKYVAGIGLALLSSSSSSPATSCNALSFWPRPTTPSNRERG